MQHITYAQAVREAETFLGDHGIADAPIDAWLLFSCVTGISRAMFLHRLAIERKAATDAGILQYQRKYLFARQELLKRNRA